MQEFFTGYLLALASLAPIGMQNAYVINIASRCTYKKTYGVTLVIFLMDAVLVITTFLFMGAIIGLGEILRMGILFFGSIIITFMGVGLIRAKPDGVSDVNVEIPVRQIILSCFTVTWLNPQALIDGALILGGYRASIPPDQIKYFLMGTFTASFSWLFFLSTVTSILKNFFTEKTLRIINIACGIIMLCFAVKYALNFWEIASKYLSF